MRVHVLTAGSIFWLLAMLLARNWRESVFALIVSGILISINFVVSLCILMRAKRIAVRLNVAQIALFGLLHAQVFVVLGSHHYRCEGTPNLGSWIEFTALHTLRVADPFDLAENYGITWQTLRHRSVLAGLLLVALHLSVGLFLIAFAVRGVMELGRRTLLGPGMLTLAQQRELAEDLGEKLWLWQKRCLLPLILVLATCAVLQRWRPIDLFLWPLDKLARLADIADVMDIFRWRLHAVPSTFVTGSLSLAFHLLVGLCVVRWINTWHLRLLGRSALCTLDDYIDELTAADEHRRALAVCALGSLGASGRAAIPAILQSLTDDSALVGDVSRVALERLGRGSPESVPCLLELLNDPNWAVRRGAVDALRKIGPAAHPAIPALVARLPDEDPLLSGKIEQALTTIAPYWPELRSAQEALPELVRKLHHQDPRIREAAVDTLGRFGPAAVAAVPALLLSRCDANEFVRFSAGLALDRIDPYWRDEILDQAPEDVPFSARERLWCG